jgi:hypothetical protein
VIVYSYTRAEQNIKGKLGTKWQNNTVCCDIWGIFFSDKFVW